MMSPRHNLDIKVLRGYDRKWEPIREDDKSCLEGFDPRVLENTDLFMRSLAPFFPFRCFCHAPLAKDLLRSAFLQREVLKSIPRPSSYPLLGPKCPLLRTIYPQLRVLGGSWLLSPETLRHNTRRRFASLELRMFQGCRLAGLDVSRTYKCRVLVVSFADSKTQC